MSDTVRPPAGAHAPVVRITFDMPRPLRSLTGKTLLRLALGGAAVLLATSLVGTYVLYRQSEGNALERLRVQVGERARLADRVLAHPAETHETVRQAFLEKWPAYRQADLRERFDRLMTRYPDGSVRNRKEFGDGRVFPTGWIGPKTQIDADLRSRVMLFHDLAEHFGPGAALRHDNLFFVSLPEEANLGYDPYLYPNWIFDIAADFTQLDYEWGRLAYTPAPPGTPTRFTVAEIDEVGSTFGPVFTAVTPVHVGGRQLAAICTTLLLNDFLSRVQPPGASDLRHLLFAADGRLMGDTAFGDAAERPTEIARLARQLGERYADALIVAARASERLPQSGYSRDADAYFAVAQVQRAGWFVATSVDGRSVRTQALAPGLWALGVGLGVLMTLLGLFAWVLRRQIAAPLGELTRAAEQLAAGDTAVRLPATRADELGRLAVAFNDMTGKVAARDAALREDKRNLEEALNSIRLTEERWRAMTDNASDFIAVIDTDGRITYASSPVRRMLGLAPENLIGRDAFSFVHPDDQEKVRRHHAFQTGAAVQYRARHADGRWRELEAVSSDMQLHPGVQGFVLNIRDVTDTLEAERELARQRDAMHQSEKLSALGGLLAGVAHELNNPLAVVVGRAAQMQTHAATPADRDTASKIRQAAERCARIVKTFLAMARRQESVRAPVDVRQVIVDALDLLSYSLESGGIAVQTHFDPQLPPVLADADQLGQVFMNLFTNAQQAMSGSDRARVLRVEARGGASGLEVRVADSGPGIADETAKRIFDPFFTTKAVGEGTGVGLSVSLGIVQSHGGSLAVEPFVAGEGASFVLRLPAAPSAVVAAAGEDVPDDAVPGGWRILAVDDEVEIAEILRDILQPLGHEVVLAADGQAALQRLAAQRFDLVLTDLKMPGMDGPALFREIVRRHPSLARRVIAISGDTLGTSARRFIETSGVPVIDKPFSPREVVEKVEAVMASPVGGIPGGASA